MKGERFSFSLVSFALLRIREILTHNWGVVKLFECKEKIKWCWVKSVVIPLSPHDQPSSNTPDKWNATWPRSIVRSGIRQKTRSIIKCTSGLSSLKKQISRLQDPFASCKLLCATCYVLRHLISIARQLLYSILTPAMKASNEIYLHEKSFQNWSATFRSSGATHHNNKLFECFFQHRISSLLNWGGREKEKWMPFTFLGEMLNWLFLEILDLKLLLHHWMLKTFSLYHWNQKCCDFTSPLGTIPYRMRGPLRKPSGDPWPNVFWFALGTWICTTSHLRYRCWCKPCVIKLSAAVFVFGENREKARQGRVETACVWNSVILTFSYVTDFFFFAHGQLPFL